MIVVRLMGGFANQLFQYAAGRSLSIKLNEKVYLDTSFLQADTKGYYTKRDYALDQICINGEFVTQDLLSKFKTEGVLNKLLSKLQLNSHSVFNENKSTFMTNFNRVKGNVLLNGYWQSEKYFSQYRNQLLTEITPSYEFTDKAKMYLKMINESDSVSIHVRRGDYVTHQGAADFHGILDLNYYKNSVDHIKNKIRSPKYFIFSDDIEWCIKNMNFISDAVFVEDEPNKRSSQDMFIMSHCKHQIIANSSYSWWAAWLNQNINKIVIAPDKWFEDKSINTSDLYPKGWLRF